MRTGVSYFGSRDPRHVKRDLADIVAHNCNFVVHTYSEADMYFYSAVMKEIVDISHDAGLDVYIDPWGVGGVFGGEALSRFVAEHPDECQQLADGTHVPAACLNSEAFLDFMKMWVFSAMNTGADIIFWDEPHFYITPETWSGRQGQSQWACRCKRCRDLFRDKFARDMPVVMDKDVIRFRDDSIVNFFTELAEYGSSLGVRNALCILPDETPLKGVSSWELLAQIESIDILGTDPYWLIWDKPLEDYVARCSRRIIDIAGRYGKEAQVWVLAFMIPQGREEEVARAVKIMVDQGIENIAAWSYLGGAFMNIKSDNHERVWEILGEAYGEIVSR